MFFPHTLWTVSFLAVVFLQAVLALGLEIYIFARFEIDLDGNALLPQQAANGTFSDVKVSKSSQSRTIPTYLSVYIFGFLYQIVLVWDALRLKNTIQVLGLCAYNVGMLIYSAIQMDQIKDAVGLLARHQGIAPNYWAAVHAYLVAVPCIIGFCTLCLAFIAWKLYGEFSWTIYKHISADLRMKRRYLTYQIYIALLKFDFFFFLGFTVQFLVVVVDTSDSEFSLTIAAVPVTVLILLAAAYWTRRESVWGMVVVIVLYFAALAYFLFKLVRMYDTSHPKRLHTYLPARDSLTTFAVITILLLIVTIVYACMCTHNFNKGLKPHIAKRKVPDHNDKAYGRSNEMPDLSGLPAGSRMTID